MQQPTETHNSSPWQMRMMDQGIGLPTYRSPPKRDKGSTFRQLPKTGLATCAQDTLDITYLSDIDQHNANQKPCDEKSSGATNSKGWPGANEQASTNWSTCAGDDEIRQLTQRKKSIPTAIIVRCLDFIFCCNIGASAITFSTSSTLLLPATIWPLTMTKILRTENGFQVKS